MYIEKRTNHFIFSKDTRILKRLHTKKESYETSAKKAMDINVMFLLAYVIEVCRVGFLSLGFATGSAEFRQKSGLKNPCYAFLAEPYGIATCLCR